MVSSQRSNERTQSWFRTIFSHPFCGQYITGGGEEQEGIGQTDRAIGYTEEVDALEENSIVHIDGKAYLRSEYTVDFGPKNGCCRVEVLDPCITEDAQQKRREAILKTCQELMRKGHM